jgi:hypothetical protein
MLTTVATETVTPATAKYWLTPEINANNRRLKVAIVRKYVRDMEANNWMFNGDTIKFDRNGKLLDGQHRLHAVVVLHRPVEFLIVRGLDPAAYTAIDTGARRTVGDMLQHIGSKQSAAAAAASKVMFWYEAGQPDFNATYSTAQLIDAYVRHPGLEEHVARYNDSAFRKKLRAGAAWPVVSYLASRELSAEWATFAKAVADGIELQKGDPRHTLREWFLNRLQSKRLARNDERFNVISKAWNAHVEGRKLQLLSHRFTEAPVSPVMSR